jgi:cytidylate kinase
MNVIPIIIAIDGYSACGKSTLAKDLSRELAYTYVDSGAMYRAVSYYSIENNIPLENLKHHLEHIKIDFLIQSEKQHILLNGKDITTEIRSAEVNAIVSPVATISEVRAFLVEQQKFYGIERGIVMDGRDIGSVVFPDAELKLFITADIDIRTRRRCEELGALGIEYRIDEVKANLLSRDHIDSTRTDSPLTICSDAIIVDNSDLSKEEQLNLCLKYVQQVIHKKRETKSN